MLYIDTRRFVSEALNYFRRASKYDLTKIINGKEIFAVLGAVWAYMGFFGISKNLLRRTGYGTEQNDINSEIALKGAECLIHVCAGTWYDVPEFDSALVAHAVRSGKFWDASLYIRWHGILKVSQGKFGEAEGLIANLSDLANSYDHDVARLYYYMLKMDLLLKRQDIHQALFQAEEGIPFTAKEGLEAFQTWFAGFKGLVQVMMSEAAPAEVILRQTEELVAKQGYVTPAILLPYQTARFLLYLQTLEKSESQRRQHLPSFIKTDSAKALLGNAKRYAPGRTNILRLLGRLSWLNNKQRAAIRWWDYAIREGERFGARPDLSRTYMEVGRRLLEPQSKYRELNGIGAKEYLDKAEKLFREMDLQWDLEQLERVRAGG